MEKLIKIIDFNKLLFFRLKKDQEDKGHKKHRRSPVCFFFVKFVET